VPGRSLRVEPNWQLLDELILFEVVRPKQLKQLA